MDEAEHCGRLGIMNRGKLLALDFPSALKRDAVPGQAWNVVAQPLVGALDALTAAPGVRYVGLLGDHLHAITAPAAHTADTVTALLRGAGFARPPSSRPTSPSKTCSPSSPPANRPPPRNCMADLLLAALPSRSTPSDIQHSLTPIRVIREIRGQSLSRRGQWSWFKIASPALRYRTRMAVQKIGRYRILRQFGRAAPPWSTRAATPTGKQVAIKVFYTNVIAAEGFGARFAQLLPALAALDHPYLVPLLDYGTEGRRSPRRRRGLLPGAALHARRHW